MSDVLASMTGKIWQVILMAALAAPFSHAATENVKLVKVLDNTDKLIIERRNGEKWLIEKGVGAVSAAIYEGRTVIIYSPGVFAGVGSKIMLTNANQEARIWNSELLEQGVASRGSVTQPPTGQYERTDGALTMAALKFLGYGGPTTEVSEWVSLLKRFERDQGLPVTGKVSGGVQLALSRAILARRPTPPDQLRLANDLINSAKKLSGTVTTEPASGIEVMLSSASATGSTVRLMDGRIFEVESASQYKTMLWLPADRILVGSLWLLNMRTGDRVQCTEVR